jgi:flagellar hook-basal body complex protein FliE
VTAMDLQQRLRQIRWTWGWILLVTWIGYWIYAFPEGLVAKAAYSFWFLIALMLSPLAFAVSHVIARAVVDSEARVQNEADAREQARLREEQQQASEARQRLALEQDRQRRQTINRDSFMKALGAASDSLNLLLQRTDPGAEALLRLDAINALRDVVAQHRHEALVELLRGDKSLLTSIGAAIRKLDQAGLGSEPEALILKRALVDAFNSRTPA